MTKAKIVIIPQTRRSQTDELIVAFALIEEN